MAIDTGSDTVSNVALVNKVCAESFTLRQPVKNQIGGRGKNRKFLRLAEWDVRTLMDTDGSKRPERQTALVAKELSRYDIDIAALGETQLPLHDSMAENGYTFFWSGRGVAERREAGLGFAIKNSIVQWLEQEPTAVTMRLPLKKNAYATIISAYAPNMTNPGEIKEGFYSTLRNVVKTVSITNKLIIAGDFNARVGREVES